MNSKSFPFYNLGIIFLITILAIGWMFVAPPAPPGHWFGPGAFSLFILMNPVFWAWWVISIICWIMTIWIKDEGNIRRLNFFLLILPLLLITFFFVIVGLR